MEVQASLDLQVLLAEYGALRQEIVQRISNRVQLLIASLTVSGLIIGLAVERSSAVLLLVAPLWLVYSGLKSSSKRRQSSRLEITFEII